MAEAVGTGWRPRRDVAAPPDRHAQPMRVRPPQSGLRIGQLAGIELRIDWSLAIVFWLIVGNLGLGLLPTLHPGWAPALRWTIAVAAALLFFASILVHELAHALVARARGVPVEGITLFIFGGVARMGAEPKSPATEFLMAAVGPLTSLVIGLLCLLIAGTSLPAGTTGIHALALSRLGPVATVLMWLGSVNITLAVFNCLPGFPLDGGRVLRAVLWWLTGNLRQATRWATGIGRAFACLLMVAGLMMLFGFSVPFLGRGFVQGLWLLFIGWFLNNAALRSYQQLVMSETLTEVPVGRVMRKNPQTVPPELSVSGLVDRFLDTADHCLAVMDGPVFRGLVCETDLGKISRQGWDTTPVERIMTPVGALVIARPDEPVAEALRRLAENDVDQLPVIEDGALRGLLRRGDIIRWLELSGGPAARAV